MVKYLTDSSSLARLYRGIRRFEAWLAAGAEGRETAAAFVLCFIVAHVVLWTVILTLLKARQDIHFDVAEAYDWGQQFLLGYGKHPPLSGWIAGLWFMVFPAANWATYALAMTMVGGAMWVSWLIALRVVDRRRAFVTVAMLALYPIFNFKGYKYNADIVQLLTLPLVVLAYLHAFEKRTVRSGIWLGLAGAAAMMTKYWALTIIGAVGIAALLHPMRLLFLRSPAPWVAIGTMLVAMLPHLWWLKQVNFLPFTYAGGVYALSNRALSEQLAWGYVLHNISLLLFPVLIAVIAVAPMPRRWATFARKPWGIVTNAWSRGPNPGVRTWQALNVWIIQIVIAIGPPLGGAFFAIYMKTDWGIPLFFLTPLALLALPALRIQRIAMVRLLTLWFVISGVVLATSPLIARYTMPMNVDGFSTYSSHSELARQLTEIWQTRFHSRWSVVAATTEAGEPITFYSPDHPTTFTPDEVWTSGLSSVEEAKRLGFIGVCDTTDPRLQACESWMAANAGGGERIVVTTRRFYHAVAGVATRWNIYVVPPAK